MLEAMNMNKLDALVASTPENVSYLCDIPQVPRVVSEAEAHGVTFREGEPALVIPAVAVDQWAQSESPVKDVKTYGEFYYYKTEPLDYGALSRAEKRIADVYFGHPGRKREIVAALVELFRERDLVKGRVGFDEMHVPTSRLRLIKKKLPKVRFVAANSIFQEIRMVKSPDEIERIRKAVEATEQAIQAVMEASKPGVKNTELQSIYRTTIMRQGCIPFFGVIGAGTESAIVNHLPSEYVLQEGDIMRIDCNATYKNYVSDVGRNAVIGTPTDKAQKYFDALRKGTEEMETRNSDPGSRSLNCSRLLYPLYENQESSSTRDRTLATLGLQVVEPPIISPKCSTKLLEDMVIAIETPYYELGFGAFNPEDTVRVTKNGSEKLSTTENKLYAL